MDWSKLPDVIASGLMTWAFVSVSRSSRATESANWLRGWYFIVLHFLAQLFQSLPGAWGEAMSIISLMSLVMAALLYIRASAAEPYYSGTACTTMIAVMATFFLCFISAIVLGAPRWVLFTSEALISFGPLGVSLILPRWTNPFLRWTTSIFSGLMSIVLWRVRNLSDGPSLALNAALFAVYFACTIHFWYRNRRATPGAVIGVAGFLLWASVFVLAPALGSLTPPITLEGEIWNLPKYIVAVGMILLVLEDQINHNKYLALHDELTALPNRRLFRDRLDRAIERARRLQASTALLVIDLDEFKGVNDSLGHDVGDQLLQQVSSLFNGRIRTSDTVARTGGDEFAVILEPPATQKEALLVSRALQDLLRDPVRVGEHDVQIGASIGIAVFPEDAMDAKSLCIHADMRMYENKRGTSLEIGFEPRRESGLREQATSVVRG